MIAVTLSALIAALLSSLLPDFVWAHEPVEGGFRGGWNWRPDVLFVVIFLVTTYSTGWLWLRARYPRIAPWWRLGCHWNREPLKLVREAGLRVVTAHRAFFGVFHVVEAKL